jgi:arylsulfatase A-like enzyme
MYDPDSLRLRQNGMIIPRDSLDPAWAHRPTTADYYALITSMDGLLGRILDRLEADGTADNTIIVFTSDHGDMMWSQGLLYKCVPYEESVNVPLIFRWPAGLPKGEVCDTLVNTPDMLPTLAALMGLPIPATVEGQDLSAALQGRPDAPRPASAFLSQYTPYVFRNDKPTPPWRGVRTERYTYAETPDRQPWLFFDNERDPYQFVNLVGVPEYQSVANELHTELDGWLQRLDDPFLPQAEMRRLGTPARWPEEPERDKPVPVY